MNRLLRFLSSLLLLSVTVFAAPKDVRRVLKERGFTPENVRGPIVMYPEPEMTTHYIPKPPDEISVTEFDPLPKVSKELTAKQSAELAGILADSKTYIPQALGEKLCMGFHADVAIRISAGEGGGSAYILLCFTCNQIRIIEHTQGIGFADIDRGRNRLLLFLQSVFPKDKQIRKLELYKPVEGIVISARELLDAAQTIIPDDPLLQRLLALKPGEVSDEDLEEIDARCVAESERYRREGPTEAPKERAKREPRAPGLPGLEPPDAGSAVK
jgi:hypothetical protein